MQCFYRKIKISVLSKRTILLEQFRYIDKSFLVIYALVTCVTFLFVLWLAYLGVTRQEIVTVCMIGSGIFSTVSILLINKLFFGGISELAETCYFNTKQSVSAYMILAAGVNMVMLLLLAVCVKSSLEII